MSYILLIEDNPDNAEMMIRLLKSIDMEVIHYVKGLDAAKYARQNRPGLVLMDFNLPDIDGRTLSGILKKQLGKNPPPFIAVTARTGHAEEYLARRFGCDAFINKPFDPEEFVATVKQFVDRNDPTSHSIEGK